MHCILTVLKRLVPDRHNGGDQGGRGPIAGSWASVINVYLSLLSLVEATGAYVEHWQCQQGRSPECQYDCLCCTGGLTGFPTFLGESQAGQGCGS